MRLLFISEFFPKNDSAFSGGVEARTYYTVRQLQDSGHEVQVVSRSKSKITASADSILPRIKFMITAIRKGLVTNFDLVEGSNFITYLPAFIIGSFRKKPKVAWFADVLGKDWFTYFGFLTAIGGFILEWLSLKLLFDGYIALSQKTKDKLIKRGVESSKIKVIYGGVGLQTADKLTVKKAKVFTVICVARLVSYKRIEDAIQAFAYLNNHEARLIIVGQGPEKEKLKLQAATLNLEDRVEFLKPIKDHSKLLKQIKSSHLLVLPSLVEGFGLVTIEAMACGVPCVIADTPIHREITQGGKGCLFHSQKSAKSLAETIDKLLTNANLYQQKQAEALALAKTYTWEEIIKQTLTFYNQVRGGVRGQ